MEKNEIGEEQLHRKREREASLPRNRDRWTFEIWVSVLSRARIKNVGAILEYGQLLIEAKARDGKYGSWLDLLEKAGVHPRIAQRMMAIARNAALANTTNQSHLPPVADTLEVLSRMPAELINAAIEAGNIHPQMTVKDARALVVGAEAEEPDTGPDTGEGAEDEEPDEAAWEAEDAALEEQLTKDIQNKQIVLRETHITWVRQFCDEEIRNDDPDIVRVLIERIIPRHLQTDPRLMAILEEILPAYVAHRRSEMEREGRGDATVAETRARDGR